MSYIFVLIGFRISSRTKGIAFWRIRYWKGGWRLWALVFGGMCDRWFSWMAFGRTRYGPGGRRLGLLVSSGMCDGDFRGSDTKGTRTTIFEPDVWSFSPPATAAVGSSVSSSSGLDEAVSSWFSFLPSSVVLASTRVFPRISSHRGHPLVPAWHINPTPHMRCFDSPVGSICCLTPGIATYFPFGAWRRLRGSESSPQLPPRPSLTPCYQLQTRHNLARPNDSSVAV